MYQGLLRLVLASIVVVYHFFKTGPMTGKIAVFGFFVISGYLITRVCCQRYVGEGALKRFWTNRFLRLYPAYLVVLLFSLFVILASGRSDLNDVMLGISWPQTLDSWVRQFVIVGLIEPTGGMYPVRLIPVAFSLAIELGFYALISFGVGRSPRLVFAWWIVSAAIALVLMIRDDFSSAYFTYWGPSLMFASGAALHHLWPLLKRHVRLGRNAPLFALGAIGALAVYAFSPALIVEWDTLTGEDFETVRERFATPSTFLLYLSLPLTEAALYLSLIVEADATDFLRAPWIARTCAYLGDLSYPLFLVHTPMRAAVQVASPHLSQASGGILAIALSVGASLLIVTFVERPVERLRQLVRMPDRTKPARAQPAAFGSGATAAE